MIKRGRPFKTGAKNISISVPVSKGFLKIINSYCAKKKRPRGAILREIIKKHFQGMNKK